MISTLKVKNIRGVSYEMHFSNGRDTNNFPIKGDWLFRTFQVLSENRKDSKRVLLAINLLKVLLNPNVFSAYCNGIQQNITSEIEIEFYSFDPEFSKYAVNKYYIAFDKDGIHKEVVNEELITRFFIDDPYESAMPLLVKDYFESILSFDLANNESFEKLLSMAKNAINSVPFKDFCINFMESLGYESLSDVRTVTGNTSLNFIFEDSGAAMALDSSSLNFKHLFAVSIIAFIRPIVPGIVIINNVDEHLTSSQVNFLLNFINHTAIDRPMQMIIGSDKVYDLFPEQVIKLAKKQNMFICEWQNY
jgi:hypothetical protein